MASPLESQIRKAVNQGFKGQLLSGTYRRHTPGAGVDEFGDPSAGTHTTESVNGIVDSYSAFYKATANIPDSDVRVLIIAGSLSLTPQKDDQVKFRETWYQVRQISRDPARATWELQCFEIEDPT